MGCETTKTDDYKKQCLTKNVLMPEMMINKLSDTIVRIEFQKKISTGFFMKIELQTKQHNFLLTCSHSISQEDIDSKITIKIYYGKMLEESERNMN